MRKVTKQHQPFHDGDMLMGQQGCCVKKILGHLQEQIDSLSSLTPENYTFFKVNIKLQPAARLLKSSYSDSKKLSRPVLDSIQHIITSWWFHTTKK